MKLLVIGGGMAGCCGIAAVRQLDKDVEIVLVEPKDYMEVLWASYRSPFDDKTANDSTYELGPFCKANNVTQIRTTVESLTTDQATLADDTVIEFDVCLVAVGASIPWTGSGNGLPQGYDGSRAGRLAHMKAAGQELLDVKKRLLIIGGGMIGSELAGDVAYFSGGKKKVTLVHSKKLLGDPAFIKPPAAKMIQRKLTKLGVEVILGAHAAVEDDGVTVVLQETGQTTKADQIVRTTGLSPLNKFVAIDNALTDRGFLDTDDMFVVAGSNGKVLGYGDCCITLPNSGSELLGNMSIIGNNLKAALDGKTTAMKKAKPGPVMAVVTVGSKTGVAQTPLFKTQFVLPAFKNKTQFLSRVEKFLGLE